MSILAENSSIGLIKRTLDVLWLRQKVITNNIANIDTPGYKAKSVEFESLLESYLKAPAGGKLPEAKILQDNTTSVREDGNNVDIDAQNIELVRTQIEYEYMTRMISDAISREKYVISEGRR